MSAGAANYLTLSYNVVLVLYFINGVHNFLLNLTSAYIYIPHTPV